MFTYLPLALLAASLPADPVVRADFLFTGALTGVLLLQAGLAIALLPWREADLRRAEVEAGAWAEAVARWVAAPSEEAMVWARRALPL